MCLAIIVVIFGRTPGCYSRFTVWGWCFCCCIIIIIIIIILFFISTQILQSLPRRRDDWFTPLNEVSFEFLHAWRYTFGREVAFCNPDFLERIEVVGGNVGDGDFLEHGGSRPPRHRSCRCRCQVITIVVVDVLPHTVGIVVTIGESGWSWRILWLFPLLPIHCSTARWCR